MKTFDELKVYLDNKFKNEITLLELYKEEDIWMCRVQHNCEDCLNGIYTRKYTEFIKRKTIGCTECKNPESFKRKSFRELKERLQNEVGNDYTLVDIYREEKSTHWVMKLKHNCEYCNNFIFDVRTDNFFTNGNRYPECKRLPYDRMLDIVNSVHSGEIEVISPRTEYSNTKTELIFKHKCFECNNHTWSAKVGDVIYNKTGCPICSVKKSQLRTEKSKGESLIGYYLDNHSIDYSTHKIYKDCKDKSYLPFDFHIISLDITGEYDGKQHFILNSPSFGTDLQSTKEQFKRDVIKTKYCIDNGLPFLRIPYTEIDNIGEILDIILNHPIPEDLEDYDILYINMVEGICIINEDGIYRDMIYALYQSDK